MFGSELLRDLTPCFSYDALVPPIFVSSPLSLTIWGVPFLVRARVPSDALAFGVDICLHSSRRCYMSLPPAMSQVSLSVQSRTQFCSIHSSSFQEGTPAFVMQCVLTSALSSVPSTPPAFCRTRALPLFSGDHRSVSLYYLKFVSHPGKDSSLVWVGLFYQRLISFI